MSFLHRHKLPVAACHTLPGTRQTAPAADPSTAPAAGAESSSTFTAATGRGMDATREAHMGAPHVTAGVSAVAPAEFFTRRITAADVQVCWAHNDPLRPTLADLQRVMLMAERDDDPARVERYRPVTRAYLVRAQREAL